jgi:glutathionyl-hydroquinone reductase
MEAFGVTKTPVRLSAAQRFKLWIQYDCPWTAIGVVTVLLVFGIGLSTSETKWGDSEKCWNWGGRSDDTFNC